MNKLLHVLFIVMTLCLSINLNAQVAINTTGAVPVASSMLNITSTTSGLLIPRMTLAQKTAIVAPATGLLVYQTNGAIGFYYWDGTAWIQLTSAPSGTEWWIRPVAAPYIQPISNANVRVYDGGQTYGIYYNGNTNQYGAWLQTSSATTPTSAVAGFSDITGNQTYGYLGYYGNYSDGGLSVDGSGVYGVVDDPNRCAVFGRTTLNASVAAVIGYSNVWIPGYFKGRHTDVAYAGRPGVYGEMTTTVDVADYQSGVQGYSTYTGAANSGYTVGGYFIGVGGSQDSYGVMGLASNTGTARGVGVYGESSDNVNGSDYYSNNIGAVEGNGAWNATTYNFGVIGRMSGTGRRSGGVMGTYWTTDWGSLGYLNSAGTAFGLCYVGAGTTTAKGTNHEATDIGMGGSGDLMGGWINGNIYGLNIKGSRYSLYTHGRQYSNDIITLLADVPNSESRIPTYVTSSMTVDVYARGTSTIINGEAEINFPKSFKDVTSDTEPVIVTVTLVGRNAGLYIDNSSKNGFKVIAGEQSFDKATPLQFTWIAVGTRKGYENPITPEELIPKSYETNMEGVMFNENDLINSATPIWWDGQHLHFDSIPPSLNNKTAITKEGLHKNIKLIGKQSINKSSLNSTNND